MFIHIPFVKEMVMQIDRLDSSGSFDDRFDALGFRLRPYTSSCGLLDRTVTRINRRFYLRTRSPHGRCNKLEAIILTPIPEAQDTRVVCKRCTIERMGFLIPIPDDESHPLIEKLTLSTMGPGFM